MMYYVIYRTFRSRATTAHKLMPDVIDWEGFSTMREAKEYVGRSSTSRILKIIRAVDQRFVDDLFFNQHFPGTHHHGSGWIEYL